MSIQFFFIINSLMMILSWVVAFISMRAYAKASVNKIDSLHWGVSFFLVGVNFIVYMGINAYTPNSFIGHSVLAHFIDTYVWLTQLAIAIRLFQANRHCKNRSIRLTRITMEIVKVLVLSAFIVFVFDSVDNMTPVFKYNIQLLGSRRLDYIVEITHAVSALLIAILIPAISYYILLKIGFGLLAVSELIQLHNIRQYFYMSQELILIEWILAVVGLFAILLGMLAIDLFINTKDSREKDDKREDFNPIAFAKRVLSKRS